ncbi:MAG: PQQ-binding-like beta-propeller repeat protein [Planctomycetes bacterium]|nr:PQQ-binding-like beta-propeller repeat protein [Planctomycetota bacterium]
MSPSLRRGLAVLLLAVPAMGQQHWPQFRGARAQGIAEGFATPASWDVSKGKNVLWKTPVPGLAHSSPVVWGDRMFVTTTVRKGAKASLESLYGSEGYGRGDSVKNEPEHDYLVYCLDKNTGKVKWKSSARAGVPKVKRHPKSSHANPTPACTAERVVVSFGSEGLYCYDHNGKLIWMRDFGVLNSGAPGNRDKNGYQWGFASSPIIHKDRVYVQCDHEGDSFVAALRIKDGKDIWRTARDENSTWCTPTVHETGANGRPQLLVNGYKHIGGYDLENGKEMWKLVGGGDVPVPTPVVAYDLVFLTSAHGRSRPLRAVKVTASGTVGNDADEDDNLVWYQRRRGVYMQTPLVHDGLLYACSDGGILSCYDARTGENHYRERLGSGRTGFSGSAVYADGKLYLTGESGEISVVKVGATFELLATNEMGETCMSTPAISEGTLFFRTREHVVAIRAEKER